MKREKRACIKPKTVSTVKNAVKSLLVSNLEYLRNRCVIFQAHT